MYLFTVSVLKIEMSGLAFLAEIGIIFSFSPIK